VAGDAAIRRAATVLVLRDSSAGPEVLMVRRHDAASFMGGAYVFPGGALDDADLEVQGEALAFHVAAARELFEEAGLLLARDQRGQILSIATSDDRERFSAYRRDLHHHRQPLRVIVEKEHLQLALDALVPFAHWVTPSIDKRRFDTQFFVAPAPPDQTPVHDETETSEIAWMRPAVALEAARRNAMVLPPPTWVTLAELEPFESVDHTLAWTKRRTIVRRQPTVVVENGARTIVMPPDVAVHPRFVFDEGRWHPA
jgi:8-oxo-dGTP pyrophosphatase MutT (NUDIX family)